MPSGGLNVFDFKFCAGTEGWIDAAGYFRLKDYMANENGYNIIRSKIVYVGVDRPIPVSAPLTSNQTSHEFHVIILFFHSVYYRKLLR